MSPQISPDLLTASHSSHQQLLTSPISPCRPPPPQVRREKDVIELHTSLVQLMKFVPDPPVSERRWLWRGAEQLGTLQHRLQDYLTELTINGQWVWDEAAVLRHFLQIPVTSENRQVGPSLSRHTSPYLLPPLFRRRHPHRHLFLRHSYRQAREVLLKDIRAHKLQAMRSKLLDDIRQRSFDEGVDATDAPTPRTAERARAATEAFAVLTPTDARDKKVPDDLSRLQRRASSVEDQIGYGRRRESRSSRESQESRVSDDEVPRLRLSAAL